MMKIKATLVILMMLLLNTNLSAQIEKKIEEDLNGDGRPEKILCLVEPSGRFTLSINQASYKGKFTPLDSYCDEPEIYIGVRDIDRSDKFQEVIISIGSFETDSCKDHEYQFYSYHNGQITQLWSISGIELSFSGNGIIRTDTWMEFWSRTDKYLLDKKKRTVVHVPQAFYYVGKEVNVNQSIPIFRNRNRKNRVANLKPNSICFIILYDPSGWYLIKSTTGLVGWTKDIRKLDLPIAG